MLRQIPHLARLRSSWNGSHVQRSVRWVISAEWLANLLKVSKIHDWTIKCKKIVLKPKVAGRSCRRSTTRPCALFQNTNTNLFTWTTGSHTLCFNLQIRTSSPDTGSQGRHQASDHLCKPRRLHFLPPPHIRNAQGCSVLRHHRGVWPGCGAFKPRKFAVCSTDCPKLLQILVRWGFFPFWWRAPLAWSTGWTRNLPVGSRT